MSRKGLSGLSSQIKERLIQQALERRLRQADTRPAPFKPELKSTDTPEQYYRFHLHPGYQQLRILNEGAARLGSAYPVPISRCMRAAPG